MATVSIGTTSAPTDLRERNHVVPATYLRGFAIPESLTQDRAEIFCYFVGRPDSGKARRVSVNSVPIVRNLTTSITVTLGEELSDDEGVQLAVHHDDPLERAFAEIEGQFANVMSRISASSLEECLASQEDRRVLSALVASIHARSARFQHAYQRATRLLRERALVTRDPTDELNAVLFADPEHFSAHVSRVEETVFEKPWLVYEATGNARLITSDNPVLTFREDLSPNAGYMPDPWRPDVGIRFPLTSRIALQIGPMGERRVAMQRRLMNARLVKSINQVLASYANNVFISAFESSWLASLAREPRIDPKLD